MTSKFHTRSSLTGTGELGHLSGSRVTSGLAQIQNGGYPQTQLLFNNAWPTSASNRATHAVSPSPIVIEKLGPAAAERANGDSSVGSSLCFSALSEERLQAAVRLAQRDLRRRRRESARSASPPQPTPDSKPQDRRSTAQHKQRKAGGVERQVLVFSPPSVEPSQPLRPRGTAPQPKSSNQEPKLSQEIRRLQKELGTYIQRIEQLANREQRVEGRLDPDEERRVQIRRQEQAARSARIIYMLQQQVKVIQEDLDQLRSQKIRHTRKSRAIDRLAAAHRGAVRAIQVFINQLPDQSEQKMPSHYRELGQLIRQLSLCSAKVEAGQESSVPETAKDILSKLEALDSVLSKQESPKKAARMQESPGKGARKGERVQSSSPVRPRQHSTSPPRPARGARPTSKPAPVKKSIPDGRVATGPSLDRDEVLRAGLKKLLQARGLGAGASKNPQQAKPPDRSKKSAPLRDGKFQQPTVSSRLKEKEPTAPQRDASVPWIPNSPQASPPQLICPPEPQPKCLFSHLKPVGGTVTQGLEPDWRREAHTEAVRQAYLDKKSSLRHREPSMLSEEDSEHRPSLRSEVDSPTLWAERAEREARRRLQGLLEQAQQIQDPWRREGTSPRHRLSEQAADRVAANAEQVCEVLLEELLEETVRDLWALERDRELEELSQQQLEAPTLENMLLRMEEMERDQEAVRRRFADISYSDPLFWAKENVTGGSGGASDSRPGSPKPIRLTKPVLRPQPAAAIQLQSPVETGLASEMSLMDDSTSWPEFIKPTQPMTVERGGGIPLSLPISMQKSVEKYRRDYEEYLRLVSHEPVGSFNPWVTADSLAEELLQEALADVAAEFQDVCEEYAEAVFTSEFLQPLQSPSGSQTHLDSQ
ncbi:hypothetical protein AGOR_G00122160 [Albula goreensis]|uniref:Protein moonraker n=1 Tax=Albula goreensis TaxID=1534307 RepID=A0A8T3DE93_9TELE|nr:hypothetical protein AGOR_G00122160 [Albula goreensis]